MNKRCVRCSKLYERCVSEKQNGIRRKKAESHNLNRKWEIVSSLEMPKMLK